MKEKNSKKLSNENSSQVSGGYHEPEYNDQYNKEVANKDYKWKDYKWLKIKQGTSGRHVDLVPEEDDAYDEYGNPSNFKE